jgi:hypothetical protein
VTGPTPLPGAPIAKKATAPGSYPAGGLRFLLPEVAQAGPATMTPIITTTMIAMRAFREAEPRADEGSEYTNRAMAFGSSTL